MKRSIYLGGLALAVAGGAAALSGSPLLAGGAPSAKVTQPSAGQRIATLNVVNVGCATCAPMVKRALGAVPGVADVSVREGFGATATVRVVYDPRKVTPAALAGTTTEAGYPAEVVAN